MALFGFGGMRDKVWSFVEHALEDVEGMIKGRKINLPDSDELDALAKKQGRRRSKFLGELIEVVLNRISPILSDFMDFTTMIGLRKRDVEVFKRQDELEFVSVVSRFIPRRLLKKITNPVVNTPGFKKLVDMRPWCDKVKKKILEKNDPRAVIDFLKIVNGDLTLIKVGIQDVTRRTKDKLAKNLKDDDNPKKEWTLTKIVDLFKGKKEDNKDNEEPNKLNKVIDLFKNNKDKDKDEDKDNYKLAA